MKWYRSSCTRSIPLYVLNTLKLLERIVRFSIRMSIPVNMFVLLTVILNSYFQIHFFLMRPSSLWYLNSCKCRDDAVIKIRFFVNKFIILCKNKAGCKLLPNSKQFKRFFLEIKKKIGHIFGLVFLNNIVRLKNECLPKLNHISDCQNFDELVFLSRHLSRLESPIRNQIKQIH